MAKKAASESDAPTDEGPRGRGRPRPTEVIDRDQQVFDAITDPVSKEDIVKATGLASSAVYLSLFRLKRDGRVRRHTSESGAVVNVWERVA